VERGRCHNGRQPPARGPRIITRPRAKPLATVTATCLGPNLKSAPYASISLIQPVLLKFTRTKSRTIKYFQVFTSLSRHWQSILNNSSCIL